MRCSSIVKFVGAGCISILAPIASHAEGAAWTAAVVTAHGVEAINPAVAGAVIAAKIVGPNIARNIDAAKNESGVGAQIVRGVTGASYEDVKKHGIWGGPNSFFRKPFG